MSEKRIDKKDRCRQLMMAEFDGKIKNSEKEELLQMLNKNPDLNEEYKSFLKLKEVTDTMSLKNPDPEIWETYWYGIYNKIERGLAWFILTFGAGILIVYGLGQALANLWQDSNTPILLKIGIFGALLGLILLLISVLREKLFVRRHERYKEVQR